MAAYETYETDAVYDEMDNNPTVGSAQQVPKPDPLPGISFDTRPDPIQF